jgi:3-isopropylmalate/(R)-2-methylmalate dehydratase small subunit
MEAFIKHTGIVLPMDRVDIDTDQIIPKQFLKRIERIGYGKFLFNDWRFQRDGTPNPNFILNEPRYENASILVSGRNFGCGSSREHAAWALMDYGFKALISPSFADIFYNNCFQNGILPVAIKESQVNEIMNKTLAVPNYTLTVNLESQTVEDEHGLQISFEIEEFRRYCLLNGFDNLGLTLLHEDKISDYERRHNLVT